MRVTPEPPERFDIGRLIYVERDARVSNYLAMNPDARGFLFVQRE
jgi:hypothetical protein